MNRRALLKSVMAAARVGMAGSVDASAQPDDSLFAFCRRVTVRLRLTQGEHREELSR